MGENVAVNPERTEYPNPIESDRGWGGGSNKWAVLDGERTYPEWHDGLAFTGGERGYVEPCGERQATVDFGEPRSFGEVVVWHHGHNHVPSECRLEYWDGERWVPVDSKREVDLDYEPPSGVTVTPDVHTFRPVTGSKVRYGFDNCGENVLGTPNVHGWIYEIEVFEAPPVSDRIADLPVEAIEGIGREYGSALEAAGVDRLLDLDMVPTDEVPDLADRADVPASVLYVAKRRAGLALSVRIDPALDALRERAVHDVLATPSAELAGETRQSAGVVADLKTDVATLLCALDDDELDGMTVTDFFMW